VRRGPHRIIASVCFFVALGLCGGACGGATSTGAGGTTTSRPDPASSADPPSSQPPLSAPKTSPAEDALYLTDVTKADPALASYEQTEGNVALRALLTDGSAFCAFLHAGGGIDNAMVSVALGARGVEAQTHLPSSVTTFNTIEAVSLLTLCPSYQELLPVSDRTKIRDLGDALANQSG
jgi:hypothetical protein